MRDYMRILETFTRTLLTLEEAEHHFYYSFNSYLDVLNIIDQINNDENYIKTLSEKMIRSFVYEALFGTFYDEYSSYELTCEHWLITTEYIESQRQKYPQLRYMSPEEIIDAFKSHPDFDKIFPHRSKYDLMFED